MVASIASVRLALRAPRAPRAPRALHWAVASSARPVRPAARMFGSSSRRADVESNEQAEATEGEAKIRQLLSDHFQPATLKVQDVSGGCGSFYAIQLSSKHFNGLSTVKAHRLVNAHLKHVIKDIHGLQLRTMPEEPEE